MKRFVTWSDVLALAIPATAAVAGTWHLVHNHDGNPLGRTAIDISFYYAMYAGGYVFWGALARGVGGASVLAATGALFVMGMFFSVSAALGPLIVPVAGVTSLGGVVAAALWLARRGLEPGGVSGNDAARGRAREADRPDVYADFAAFALPAILAAAAVIASIANGGAPSIALRPWALVLEYLGYAAGYAFWRFQTPRSAGRIVGVNAFVATLGILFGATWDLGVLVLLFVAMPAAGGSVAGIVVLLSGGGSARVTSE